MLTSSELLLSNMVSVYVAAVVTGVTKGRVKLCCCWGHVSLISIGNMYGRLDVNTLGKII